ncbi:DnaJ-domain-containing protein [Byssothecium circinans]|uniref:DnaJ-domain-containing protein n=1 Tax=Byssothecium circinans TaxID=147558 RepID=A0A6A5U7X5_9PLEO|nr:DnaJ-domain-containing protein [Byssothecium circinans]
MPPLVISNFYDVLQANEDATPEQILQSYKKLARKLHPDQNATINTTKAFQLLGEAYACLSDPQKRRGYDFICCAMPPSARRAANPLMTAYAEALEDAERILAIRKIKRKRAAEWASERRKFDVPIGKLQLSVRELEQGIKVLENRAAADAAATAWENGWGGWLQSFVIKKAEESEGERKLKDKVRRERRTEMALKKKQLKILLANLEKEQCLLREAWQKVAAADRRDDKRMEKIQANARAKEDREREKEERAERGRQAEVIQQQQEYWINRSRQITQAAIRQQEHYRAAGKRLEAAYNMSWHDAEQANFASRYCIHDKWWTEVRGGRASCSSCDESWSYLLQCPDCQLKACPKCQSVLRAPWVKSRHVRRVPNPKPVFSIGDG